MNWERKVNDDAVLCYADGSRAFFTTQELAKQWGDDWDDAPYEHNAGSPYGPRLYYFADGRQEKDLEHWNEDGTPKWWVFHVYYDADFETPDQGHNNSPFSVMQINRGDIAWLRPSRWKSSMDNIKAIHAGTTYRDFKKAIAESGGCVYEPCVE